MKKQRNNLKLTVLITITLISVQSISCDKSSESEERNKKKAIELVQNYKSLVGTKEGDEIKLIDYMDFVFKVAKASGTIIEIHDWSAEKISDEANHYTVTFSFREVTNEKEINWLVDIDSGSINPLDDFAEELMGVGKSY